jgi:hypothetical protein
VFRQLDKAQLESLLRYLFDITVVISILYLLQIVFHEFILVGEVCVSVNFLGMKIPRYYNQPDMLQFCAIMAIYLNPHRGFWKGITTTILIVALLGALHRSLIGMFFVVLIVGYALRLPRLKRIRFFAISAVLIMAVIIFAGTKFLHSRTFSDLQNLSSTNLSVAEEIDIEILYESTFTFRIAHLSERNQYLLEHPKAIFIGAGLIPEDSPTVEKMFDFKVGLLQELTESVVQLDTSDISYSSMLLRYGYLGTLLIVGLFVYLMMFFYKHREYPFAFFSFSYFIMVFGCSLFSSNLQNPITFLLPLLTFVIVDRNFEKI